MEGLHFTQQREINTVRRRRQRRRRRRRRYIHNMYGCSFSFSFFFFCFFTFFTLCTYILANGCLFSFSVSRRESAVDDCCSIHQHIYVYIYIQTASVLMAHVYVRTPCDEVSFDQISRALVERIRTDFTLHADTHARPRGCASTHVVSLRLTKKKKESLFLLLLYISRIIEQIYMYYIQWKTWET